MKEQIVTPHLVALDADHPGFHDAVYRRRRNEIARAATEYRDGDPVPRIDYTDDEQQVWRDVWRNLAPLHERYACHEYLEVSDRLSLSRDRIPQLTEVNAALEPLHGFRMLPVAGLVTAGAFLSRLHEAVFLSTQYMRHHSVPLYTPEPDVVHELIGHAGLRQITPEHERLAGDLGGGLLGDVAVEIVDQHLRPLAHEPFRGGAADAASRAGDDRALAVK